MKRLHLVIVALALVVLSATDIRPVWRTEAAKKREAAYQAALSAYAKDLRPGMNRNDVEEYFGAKNIHFLKMCCIEERSAFADLVKIGQEDAPWYCSERNVFVAFEFVAMEPHQTLKTYASDALKRVSVFRQLGGCL
jgi:hypothetical protein